MKNCRLSPLGNCQGNNHPRQSLASVKSVAYWFKEINHTDEVEGGSIYRKEASDK